MKAVVYHGPRDVRAAGGQTNVKAYNRHLCRLIESDRARPSFIVSHELPLEQAAEGYKHFDAREDGWTKVVLKPGMRKAALRSVTRTLALELAERGVRLNNVAPGLIDTPLTAEKIHDPKRAAHDRRQIPMHRPGTPQEVANVVAFLVSDQASYVTGTSYFVDGGLTRNLGGA